MSASRRCTRGVYGMLFIIESAAFDPLHLQEKIFAFIKQAYEKIRDKDHIFKEFYDGLIARKKEGYKDIKEEAGYYFGQMKEFSS